MSLFNNIGDIDPPVPYQGGSETKANPLLIQAFQQSLANQKINEQKAIDAKNQEIKNNPLGIKTLTTQRDNTNVVPIRQQTTLSKIQADKKRNEADKLLKQQKKTQGTLKETPKEINPNEAWRLAASNYQGHDKEEMNRIINSSKTVEGLGALTGVTGGGLHALASIPAVANTLGLGFAAHGVYSLPSTYRTLVDPNESVYNKARALTYNTADFLGMKQAAEALKGVGTAGKWAYNSAARSVANSPSVVSSIDNIGKEVLERKAFLQNLKDKKLIHPDADIAHFAQSEDLVSNLTKDVVNQKNTFYRGVKSNLPTDRKALEAMEQAGVDLTNKESIGKYYATHIKHGELDYGSGFSTLNRNHSALYTDSGYSGYGDMAFEIKKATDFSKGNYKDWIDDLYKYEDYNPNVFKNIDDVPEWTRTFRNSPDKIAPSNFVGKKGQKIFDNAKLVKVDNAGKGFGRTKSYELPGSPNSPGHAQGGQVNNNQKQNDMGSLYYMAGGWHSKNKYATGGTTLPYQMYPEYEDASGTNYDTTKKVASAGLALTQATGYNPYAAIGAIGAAGAAGFYDIAKSKENNKTANITNQGIGKQVEGINFTNSAYSQDGGYNQYNFAQGGPIWHMLGKNPQQFQMDQNNNQTSYRMGGGVGNNQDYGIITGNGSPTADDKQMYAKAGSFVVPFNKGGEIKSILEQLGYDPNKKINPVNSFATGGNKSPINISSKETYLNPEMADEVAEYLGGDQEMEEQLSPNSPHNIYAAMGGKMGNNYFLGGPPSYTTPTLADELQGIVSPADQTQAALDATRASEAARIANNEPVPVIPIKLPPPAAAPVVPPASQKTMEQLVDENDAIAKTDEMTEEARRQNKTMLGINTAKAAGMGIWNALQKNPEMPKQGRFNPMLISSNTEAMGAEQNYLSAKAGATARRAATEGNINQTVSNASIQANTLAQQVTDANQRWTIDQRVNEANVGTLNQASLYNLQADNQYNQMAAERMAAFKQNKATAISGNINDAAKGYNNYANANLGINALEKGYNAGKINEALYQKAINNPKSLTPEEIIQLNSATGGNFNPANLT